MSRPTRWAVAAFLFLAPLAGLTYAYPAWPSDAGLDLWAVPSLRAELERRERQHEELDARLQETARRMACKNVIALDLIDDRISLREAAAEFRAANADNPRFVPIMRYKFPQASEEELHARNAIETASALLDNDPRADAVRARLAVELAALLSEWR